ncbi:MAG: hypothetical protein ACRD1E_05875, partial [Terriglobales bacterium]
MKKIFSLQHSGLSLAAASALLLLGAGCTSMAGAGEQPAAAATAQPLVAPEARNVEAFLQTLPVAQTPPLDQTEAMTLAAYPLSCLDHLQA